MLAFILASPAVAQTGPASDGGQDKIGPISNMSKMFVRYIAIASLLLLSSILSGCWEEKYFSIAPLPESLMVVRASDRGTADLYGAKFALVEERAGSRFSRMRLSRHGKFVWLRVHSPEKVHWPYLEGVSSNSLFIQGKSIPPEAWRWLQTIKGMGTQSLKYGREPYDPPRYDDDLTIELTDQVLDDAFYDGLNGLLKGRKMDRLNLFLAPSTFDFCRLQFPEHYNGISIPLARYPLPPNTPIIRMKPDSGLTYVDVKTGKNITKEVRYHLFPWLYFENADRYLLTKMGRQKWRDLHCNGKENEQ